jgi:hypothetical protein
MYINSFFSICVSFYGVYKNIHETHPSLPTDKKKHTNIIGYSVFLYILPTFYHLFVSNSFNLSSICCICITFSYILGAFVFVYKIPEVYSPGTFDIWFNSHQIMHFMLLTSHVFLIFIYSMDII